MRPHASTWFSTGLLVSAILLTGCAVPQSEAGRCAAAPLRLEVIAPGNVPSARDFAVPEHRRIARLRLVNDSDQGVEFWGYGPHQPIYVPLMRQGALGAAAGAPRSRSRWQLAPRSSVEFDAVLGLGAWQVAVEVARDGIAEQLRSPLLPVAN